MKLFCLFVFVVLATPPNRPDHEEIYVVSCPVSWIDGDARHTVTQPVWAFRLENDAEIHVQTQAGCTYLSVLLEPSR